MFSRFDLTRWVDDLVFRTRVTALRAEGHVPALRERIDAAIAETKDILAGVPLYVNGAGVVPIAEALWTKGISLGTVMAFTMSCIALSIPQAIMLRRVLKPPLLALFFGAVTFGIVVIGFLFNLLPL